MPINLPEGAQVTWLNVDRNQIQVSLLLPLNTENLMDFAGYMVDGVSDSDTTPKPEPEPKPAPRGLGRAAAKEKTDEAPAEKPKTRGRRSAAAKETEQRGEPDGNADATGEPEKATEAAISNVELAKAMSHAAEKLGSDEALAALKEFGVAKVNDMKQEDRSLFLETLKILQADA